MFSRRAGTSGRRTAFPLGAWRAILISALILPAICRADWQSTSLPTYDRAFQNTNGWIGADGNFAVKLTNGLALWLFSDTLVGRAQHGQRSIKRMIHNSAALQRGTELKFGRLAFYYKQATDGQPDSLISPADGKGWFWLFDGIMSRGHLFLFLMQIEPGKGDSVFSFRQTGNWLGEVDNPLNEPTDWRVKQRKIPFARFGTNGSICFGSSILVRDGFIYIFGTRSTSGNGKTMILGRVPDGELANFEKWQFKTMTGWSGDINECADLCGKMASEYSISWLNKLHKLVLVQTESGLSDQIQIRTATEPWGTWSEPTTVYRCPEGNWGRKVFCYSAKAHPWLAASDDELIVTYAANSFDFRQLSSDARLYWPRFVRLKYSADVPATTQ